jgi:hypothetical protein
MMLQSAFMCWKLLSEEKKKVRRRGFYNCFSDSSIVRTDLCPKEAEIKFQDLLCYIFIKDNCTKHILEAKFWLKI